VHHHRCLAWYWYVATMYWIWRVISGGPFRGPLYTRKPVVSRGPPGLSGGQAPSGTPVIRPLGSTIYMIRLRWSDWKMSSGTERVETREIMSCCASSTWQCTSSHIIRSMECHTNCQFRTAPSLVLCATSRLLDYLTKKISRPRKK